MRRWPIYLFVVFVGLTVTLAVAQYGHQSRWDGAVARPAPSRSTMPALRGRVVDAEGPVAGARVRRKGSRRSTLTDQDGWFELPEPRHGSASSTITASKIGYYIEGADADPQPLTLRLRPLPAGDNPDYDWVSPHPDPGQSDNCGNCHPEIHREWQQSGHAIAAGNPQFLSVYDGTDGEGQPSEYWSLRAEYPEAATVCASCHVPTLEPSDPGFDDLRLTSGVAAEGVHCDFCHKIQDAPTADLGLAHGRYGLRLLRPTEDQVIFGPLDDVDRGFETFSPVQKESRYCASCHEGTILGVHVYSTYTEWLESPARKVGRQCQSCHMAPTGRLTNFAPDAGGIERDGRTLASHTFLPGGRASMLRRCLHIQWRHRIEGEDLKVEVQVTADDVGHRVPTGFVDRHLLLAVQPYDARGTALALNSGPTLPDSAGDDLSGLPGQLFAKLLADSTGSTPVPFWRAGATVTDNRLVPGVPATIRFDFPAQTARVRVRLIYRRFWQRVTRAKKWPNSEVVVSDQTHDVRGGPTDSASRRLNGTSRRPAPY